MIFPLVTIQIQQFSCSKHSTTFCVMLPLIIVKNNTDMQYNNHTVSQKLIQAFKTLSQSNNCSKRENLFTITWQSITVH